MASHHNSSSAEQQHITSSGIGTDLEIGVIYDEPYPLQPSVLAGCVPFKEQSPIPLPGSLLELILERERNQRITRSDPDIEIDMVEDTPYPPPPPFPLSGYFVPCNSLPSRVEPFPFHFDISVAYEKWLPSRRRMHKVSWALRMQEQRSGPSVYEPIMVSLGPYHHGKKEFRETDEFKHLCLHWFVKGNDQSKSYLYDIILGMIVQVRSCYAEVSVVNQYDDNSLALMMLLDASFIINFMKIRVDNVVAKNSYNCLGVAAALPFAARDIMLLENQIPFFVLKLVLSTIRGTEQAQNIVEWFVSGLMSTESEHAAIPREDEDPPVHILEACRRLLVETPATTQPGQQYRGPNNPIVQMQNNSVIATNVNNQINCTGSNELSSPATQPGQRYHGPNKPILRIRNNCIIANNVIGSAPPNPKPPNNASNENIHYSSHENTGNRISCPSSLTYLKSKGIQVSQSSTHSLTDIKFESHTLYGRLQLPICYVSNLTLVFLSNMIAYEVAPDNTVVCPDLSVLSYTSFMKALIQTPADVSELQRDGILRMNRFANHEQVVKLFQGIDTFNLRNAAMYQDVMLRIAEHCNSKAKTWMADLIHGKLNSPWTIIALLSATMLLVLTFLQTYFTANPPS